MLNPFPIQYLALFAYFILRLFAGFVLYYLGRKHWESRHELYEILKIPLLPFGKTFTMFFIITEFVVAGMLILGLYTQIAALILMSIALKMLWFRKRFVHPSIPSSLTYVLLLGIAITLFITGAGVFAFDLPI